jgi:hypothetical protein
MGRLESAAVKEIGPRLFRRPYSQGAPDEYQLTYVVGVVVGDEQQLAQVSLPRAMGNACEEIQSGVLGQPLQLLALPSKSRDAFIPRRCLRRGRARRPVILRPRALRIRSVPTEIEDVVLRETHVLEKLPRGVRQAVRHDASEGGVDPVHRGFEPHVRVFPVEELRQMAPKRLI